MLTKCSTEMTLEPILYLEKTQTFYCYLNMETAFCRTHFRPKWQQLKHLICALWSHYVALSCKKNNPCGIFYNSQSAMGKCVLFLFHLIQQNLDFLCPEITHSTMQCAVCSLALHEVVLNTNKIKLSHYRFPKLKVLYGFQSICKQKCKHLVRCKWYNWMYLLTFGQCQP